MERDHVSDRHLALKPGVPSFGEFQPDPSDRCLDQEPNVGRFQGKTGNEAAPAPITLSDRPYTPATAGDLGEPAIVSANEMKERARGPVREGRHEQRFDSHFERL